MLKSSEGLAALHTISSGGWGVEEKVVQSTSMISKWWIFLFWHKWGNLSLEILQNQSNTHRKEANKKCNDLWYNLSRWFFFYTVLKSWDSCGGCQKGRNSCALEHSKRNKLHFYSIFCALILISCCYPHRYWWGWQCPRTQWWCTIHWGHAPTGGWWRRRFSHGGGGLNCLPLDTSSAGWGSSRGGRDDSDDH